MRSVMNILALQGSPRTNGNTAALLSALLDVLASQHTVHQFHVARLALSPCLSCYRCQKQQTCPTNDDMHLLYPHLAHCDMVILASPIYFYGVTAQLKSVIDRCQHLWLNPLPQRRDRTGVLVLTAGAPDQYGQGAQITTDACRIFFSCLGAPLAHTLLATNTDRHPVTQQPDALQAAVLLGELLLTKARPN